MIALTCTSCKKVLEIDDAFSGGVCRCQFCGTIQTVPANPKPGGRPGEPMEATGAKTLYQKRSRANTAAGVGQSGSGLDDLANAVASSSGLARGALRTRSPQPEGTAAGKSKPTPLLITGAVIIFVLLIIILWLVIRG